MAFSPPASPGKLRPPEQHRICTKQARLAEATEFLISATELLETEDAAQDRRPDGPCLAPSIIAGDSTFALALEAQRRGHKLFHYTPDRLSLRDGKVFAPRRGDDGARREGRPFLARRAGAHRSLDDGRGPAAPGPALRHGLHHHDAHPRSASTPRRWWSTTRPGCATAPEKIFVTEFPDLMPETLITQDPQEVAAFRKEFGDIIVKPLYGNGGAGVFHLHEDDRNLASLLEMFGQMFREPFIAQRYLPGRAQGRQAHHPDRRRAGRRDQPRAGRARRALQHACRRPRRADRADRRASAKSAPASARR